jgi:uncharacterized RDD family membrane protein YckC
MNYSEDYLSIDTPENVAFGYDLAGIGSRFLAALVDTILIVALQTIVTLALALLFNTFSGAIFDDEWLGWLAAIFSLISFALFWGYYILFEMMWNGQSPGKRWVGLRVLRTDGTPITLVESLVRNLVRLVDFLPMFYGAGLVAMFINEQSRRLGDLAAGTLVVYDQAAVTLDSLSTSRSLGPLPRNLTATAGLPLERLTEQDIELVEDFLRRRFELSNSYIMAQRLIQALYARMELPPPQLSGLEQEKVLRGIVQANRNCQSE